MGIATLNLMRVLAYGQVRLFAGDCPDCKRESFADEIAEGVWKMKCCGALVRDTNPIREWKRMSATPERFRKQLSEVVKTRILRSQHWRCLYCDIGLFVPVYLNGKQVRRGIVFDHFVPWSYSQDSRESNIAACCSICNALKSWLMFKDVDECRNYLAARWKAKGYTRHGAIRDVPGLSDAI